MRTISYFKRKSLPFYFEVFAVNCTMYNFFTKKLLLSREDELICSEPHFQQEIPLLHNITTNVSLSITVEYLWQTLANPGLNT